VRAIETAYAYEEALRIIASYEVPEAPAVAVVPSAGIGCGASEARAGDALPPLPDCR